MVEFRDVDDGKVNGLVNVTIVERRGHGYASQVVQTCFVIVGGTTNASLAC